MPSKKTLPSGKFNVDPYAGLGNVGYQNAATGLLTGNSPAPGPTYGGGGTGPGGMAKGLTGLGNWGQTPEQAHAATDAFMSKVAAENDAREKAISSYYDDPAFQMKMRANPLIKPNEYEDLVKHVVQVQTARQNARNVALSPGGSMGASAGLRAPSGRSQFRASAAA